MSKLKTVKEVCALTGLKRKDLFDYDKAGVVKATDHVNNAHEGMTPKMGVTVNYCGYKLYDDNAVRLLQQIGIYQKLKIKEKHDIIQLLKTTKDPNVLLDELLQSLYQREKEIKESIIVAEQLKLFGMKGMAADYFAITSVSEVVNRISQWEESKSFQIINDRFEQPTDEYEKEVEDILDELFSIADDEVESEKAMKNIKEFFSITKQYLGFCGWFAVIGIALVIVNGGEAASELIEEVGEKAVNNCAKASLAYLVHEMDLLWDACIDTLLKHKSVIGEEYSHPGIKEMVDELKILLTDYLGIKDNEEYEVFFDVMRNYLVIDSKVMNYALEAMEYCHKNI